MIDFRYHVVSIVAVFLALTVGLVLGASFLSGAQIDILKGQITSANNAKSALEGQNRDLTGANKRLLDYIDQSKDNLVANQLTDDYVVVLRTAEADQSAADAVVALARRASANVTADVTLNPTFTDPSTADQLAALVVDYTPAGQTPSGADAVGQAMNLLAEALTAQTETAGLPGTIGGPGIGTAGAGNTATASPSPSATPKGTQSTMTADWAVKTLKAFKDIGVISAKALPNPAAMVRPTTAFIAAPNKAVPDAENAAYLTLAQDLRAR
ncbi:MAG: copper transporter, partial [Actinocrinis sp.]